MTARSNELLSWSLAERAFCAENILVTVSPNFSFGILSLMCGDFGPFIPSKFIKVPLWVAISLKKSFHCKIICPEWMEMEALEQCLKDEKEFEDTFYSLPFYWQEISSSILSCAPNDLNDFEQTRELLQQIKEARSKKLDAGLKEMDSRPLSLKNIGCTELNRIKPYLIATANQLTQFSQGLQAAQHARSPST
ncbi:hypothetical protein MDAP_002309 [Mitosporidium daphniae]|uniref:DNA replication complex GINS protein PSF2 n=1 Tax=Mitosporidium daphniae TaxID=1485682 RepID=A0A098VPW6_9MICR|nr:DNA replication complex GINS protein Psf2 [Mitosporidium daphniae]KGG51068.1 DNA replication complex GINS protein Psf2 [Mitosporidium daphniae]|eukprot:XP_013237495.1 DNA replication complex GINS protein Psf2 [Mitosporidium daphniae]